MSSHKTSRNVSLTTLQNIKQRGEKFACLTAYDACFASILSETGVEVLLVGDSLGMVKLEGGAWISNTTKLLAERGIPVCAHMGLTPQSVNRIGGFHVQGRDTGQAQLIIEEAQLLQESGANILLLECVPRELAKTITELLEIPVIGIGAGPDTTAQIMVLHDVLGVSPITPKFVKNFLNDSYNGIPGAIEAYVKAVKEQTFPAEEHCFG